MQPAYVQKKWLRRKGSVPSEWRPATVGRERDEQEAQGSYVGSRPLLIALGSYQNVIVVNCR